MEPSLWLLLNPPIINILEYGIGGILQTVIWGIALYIMWKQDGDWADFGKYFVWSMLFSVGYILIALAVLSLLLTPIFSIIFLILAIPIFYFFISWHGLIPNFLVVLLGPIAWAIGSTQDWYDD